MRVRRLYEGIVRSIALYGAPVWAGDLTVSRHSYTLLPRVERRLAIRIVRGYCTIPYERAIVLAGLIPPRYLAEVESSTYWYSRAFRQAGEDPPGPTIEEHRSQARLVAAERWQRSLAEGATAGCRAVGAVLPMISEWRDRGHGGLSFRVTQVLSGHRVFGEFLCRRNREWTPHCWLCGAARDTAQHT